MTAAVLDLLKSKGSLTSLEAQGVLRCRSLSKRISELTRLGWPITRVLKEDTTGQRYARYSLQATSLGATSLGATGQTT
ncbi:helix-turn-helix domain-containing protein [Brucella sp. 2716]|uniref:helix-turn-helix domain-containing protein n=1 Tax=Brucella sp. 2716 TaxID=2975052 RepID=UPI0038F62CF1